MEKKTIDERINKDIIIFYKNKENIDKSKFNPKLKEIYDLADMYASDSKSYLKNGDKVTAFSCISYAHGLLDAVIKILDKD